MNTNSIIATPPGWWAVFSNLDTVRGDTHNFRFFEPIIAWENTKGGLAPLVWDGYTGKGTKRALNDKYFTTVVYLPHARPTVTLTPFDADAEYKIPPDAYKSDFEY
ncbi:MAG: hypothetical protein ACMX3H_16615 [Sodalis sp. (in: enterobacteria)]|uniref:hypothetical protein n=1 Tax=Sodalis sp. (in: enterobacteria) TaxID=1898979 RepID=UPI0039E40702